MNNKLKIILIAVEIGALLVLLLLGVGCQKRWIIVTGDGPRFDWYSVKEDLVPNLGSLLGSSDKDKEKETEPEEELTSEPETSETTEPVTEPPRPVVTTPPETSNPEDSTEEETEETTDPSESITTAPTDNWETEEF